MVFFYAVQILYFSVPLDPFSCSPERGFTEENKDHKVMCVFFPPSQPCSLFLVQGVGSPGQWGQRSPPAPSQLLAGFFIHSFCGFFLFPAAALGSRMAAQGKRPHFSETLTLHFCLCLISPLLWCCWFSFWRVRGALPSPLLPVRSGRVVTAAGEGSDTPVPGSTACPCSGC